jgi:hypothetical protein
MTRTGASGSASTRHLRKPLPDWRQGAAAEIAERYDPQTECGAAGSFVSLFRSIMRNIARMAGTANDRKAAARSHGAGCGSGRAPRTVRPVTERWFAPA